jgi:membrane protein required for colicin V production
MLQQVPDVNWIDYGILALIGFSILMGIIRGFVREAMSLITWITALLLGVLYFEPLSETFTKISMVGLRLILAFAIIVLTTLIVGGIISHLIARLIKFTGFGATDRFVGVLFGFVRGAVVVAAGIMLVLPTPLVKDKLWQQSILVPRIEPLSVWMRSKIPDDLLKKFNLGDVNLSNLTNAKPEKQ